MSTVRRLLLFGTAMLVAGLLVLLPARVVHHWLLPEPLQMAGIDGTVWSGGAREVQVAGLYLRNLRWTIRPLALFTGRLAYRLQADPPGGMLETDVAVGLTGTVHFATLNAALPIAALQGMARMDDIDGNVSVQLEDVELVDGWPTQLRGRVAVSSLLVKALAATPLGDFRAEFQSDDETIVGSVEDMSGMLDVAATLTLDADRSYSLIGQVGPTPTASTSVVEQLRFLGSPDARGLREFRLEGRL